MAGYIGSKSSVTQVDGYTEAEADAEFVNDPNGAITVSGSNVGIGTTSPSGSGLHIKKDTSATTNELLRLSNSAGSTTDGVKLVMEVANTSGNGAEIGTVRDGGSFNPYMYFSTSAGVGSNPVERMRIDATGAVTMPNQPAFLAHGNAASYHSVTSLGGAGTYIPFSNAVTNIGNQYNSSNFRFSAPVAGMYHFSYDIYTRTGTATEDIYSRFRVNNSSNKGYAYFYNQTGSEIHHTLTDSINIYLNAGDDLGITINGNANSDIYLGFEEARFSGYLIG